MSLSNTPEFDTKKPLTDEQKAVPAQQPVGDNSEMNISPSDLLGFIKPDLIKPKIQSDVNSDALDFINEIHASVSETVQPPSVAPQSPIIESQENENTLLKAQDCCETLFENLKETCEGQVERLNTRIAFQKIPLTSTDIQAEIQAVEHELDSPGILSDLTGKTGRLKERLQQLYKEDAFNSLIKQLAAFTQLVMVFERYLEKLGDLSLEELADCWRQAEEVIASNPDFFKTFLKENEKNIATVKQEYFANVHPLNPDSEEPLDSDDGESHEA